MKKGFSLVELLVALAVLATVAALAIPRFLSLKKQAMQTVAVNLEADFNKTLDNWKAAGGTITGNPFTSEVLRMLGSNGKFNQNGILDSEASQNIRMAIPQGASGVVSNGTDPIPTGEINGQYMACYTDGTYEYLAIVTDGYMGVVPMVDGKVPVYFDGTGDDSRYIYQQAIGTGANAGKIMVLQRAGLAWENIPLTGFTAVNGGGDLLQALNNGNIHISSIKPGEGIQLSGMDMSIATFSNPKTPGVPPPVISDLYNIGETFFKRSNGYSWPPEGEWTIVNVNAIPGN